MSLTKEELIKGEIYYFKTFYEYIVAFTHYTDNNIKGEYYIDIKSKYLDKNNYKNSIASHKFIRLATSKEKRHLQACIKAGKYVDCPEYNNSFIIKLL